MIPDEYLLKCKVPSDTRAEIVYADSGFAFIYDDISSIYVPRRFKGKSIGYLCKRSIDHEVGHLWAIRYVEKSEFSEKLKGIPFWFKTLQKFWYWNPVLRWARIKLGFSNKLWYGPDDDYIGFTRWEHELFADWWVMFGKRK
jgi:hypothetical protein